MKGPYSGCKLSGVYNQSCKMEPIAMLVSWLGISRTLAILLRFRLIPLLIFPLGLSGCMTTYVNLEDISWGSI